MDDTPRNQAPAESVPSDAEIEDEVQRLRRQWGATNVRRTRPSGGNSRSTTDCRTNGVAVEVKRSRRKRGDEA